MPRYSIIIPTTRSRLLKYSVRSVLAQTFGDFEVVVSDNHAEGVREELAKWPDPRVRLVRTDTRLPINKSWEFALDHAEGDWVILLADDDVILPGLLTEIESALAGHPSVEAVTWRHGSFVEGTYHAKGIRGRLGSPPFSGRTTLVDNRETLASLYEMGGRPSDFAAVKRRFPHPAQSAYNAKLIRRIKDRIGAVFNPTTPDYAATVAVLALSGSTLVIDKPLMVYHSTSDSNSAAGAGNIETLKRVYAELTNNPFSNVPFKGYLTNRNVIVDTLLDMRKLLPRELEQFRVDPAVYFKNVCFGLNEVRRQSGPTAAVMEELAQLDRVLEEQPDPIRREVRAYMQELQSSVTPEPMFVRKAFVHLTQSWRELQGGMLLRYHKLLGAIPRTYVQEHGVAARATLAGVKDILEYSELLFDVLWDGRHAGRRFRASTR